MIGAIVKFFQTELESYFKLIGSANPNMHFPTYHTSNESINFADQGINVLMVNLEEENTLRKADMFTLEKSGKNYPAFPEIRLNIHLLFVANLSDYVTSLDMLSLVIQYFQSRRIFEPENSPNLPDGIDKLTIELVTMPYAQQDEVWNALRTAYKPSVLYKVRMLVYQQTPSLSTREIEEVKTDIHQK